MSLQSVKHLTAALFAALVLIAPAQAAVDQPAGKGTRALVIEPALEARSRIVEVMVHVPVDGSSIAATKELGMQMAMDAALSLAADQIRDVPPADLVVLALDYREYPVSNGKLPITLTAEVKVPSRPSASAQTLVVDEGTGAPAGPVFAAAEEKPGAPLEVRVWTQKQDFADGEEMVIRIRGNQDFYGRLFYRDVSGNVVQILPNTYRSDTLFKAGMDYVVPGPGDGFRLRVSAPFGEETVTLMASTRPLGDIPTKEAGNGMLIADASMDQIASKTRAIKLEPAGAMPPALNDASAPKPPITEPVASHQPTTTAEFVERSWKVTTHPR